MEVPYIYIDPEGDKTHRFNVMEGDMDDVAEATVVVLQSLFGKQEAFFQIVQELSVHNITKLLKDRIGRLEGTQGMGNRRRTAKTKKKRAVTQIYKFLSSFP